MLSVVAVAAEPTQRMLRTAEAHGDDAKIEACFDKIRATFKYMEEHAKDKDFDMLKFLTDVRNLATEYGEIAIYHFKDQRHLMEEAKAKKTTNLEEIITNLRAKWEEAKVRAKAQKSPLIWSLEAMEQLGALTDFAVEASQRARYYK